LQILSSVENIKFSAFFRGDERRGDFTPAESFRVFGHRHALDQ